MEGDWLKECEFDIETPINVECRGGDILITRADVIWGKSKEI